ncbi:MAG TPA: signal peptidase I [Bdellovibrionales bacterium]|nr:MAG: signal peptidase I [Bdellovibrionales bacterium GWB1_52_6]OFZ04069.1 MAG: signal peptidase I [Bdellovibrionales bacterium GWA1_52_35]OFZ41238.1 MAG: signal peptidase I [Bdellovibrionales bacterium GWC1_52_8]HAR43280.1 signal peptidase I [Bdellovibrionales bacterium]HCM39845.1 signal peptidase I [Bdellovibrionales bacterium]
MIIPPMKNYVQGLIGRLMSTKAKKWLREIVSLAAMLVVVFAIRSSFFEPFKIPSGSMIPTLFVGDHIFVSKFSYGWHLPFTGWPSDQVIASEQTPVRRGDVVVFLYPLDESLNYIKRVVGLPGDTVEMRDTVLHINDKPMPQEVVPPAVAEETFKKLNDPRFTAESITMLQEDIDGVKYYVFYAKTAAAMHSFAPFTVPKESFFAMGDDRDYSRDSRFWGAAPLKNIKGKAKFIWLSLFFGSEEHESWEFNPSRIGTLIR